MSKTFIHDNFFKEIFSHPKYAKGLFQLNCLKPHFHSLNWNTLKSEATTFIDKKGRERRTDLQFSIETQDSKEKVTLVFLIEHKSYQDPHVLLQMLAYQLGIYEIMAKDKGGRLLVKGLRPVIPILVYQGKDKSWKAPREFQDYLNWTPELKKRFGAYVVNSRPYFVNIAGLDLEKEDKDLTIYPVLYILKYIWDLDTDKLREFFKLSRQLSLEDRRVLIKSIASYIQKYDPYFSWDLLQDIEEKIITDKEGRVMSLFQHTVDEAVDKAQKESLQEGIRKGMQQGMQVRDKEIVSNMLKSHLDTSLICKVTGLSADEIQKLKNGS